VITRGPITVMMNDAHEHHEKPPPGGTQALCSHSFLSRSHSSFTSPASPLSLSETHPEVEREMNICWICFFCQTQKIMFIFGLASWDYNSEVLTQKFLIWTLLVLLFLCAAFVYYCVSSCVTLNHTHSCLLSPKHVREIFLLTSGFQLLNKMMN